MLHNGGTPGFSSAIHRYLDDRLTVIVLTNHADRIVDNLAIDIAGMYEPALKRPERTADPDSNTTRLIERVLRDLLAGRHDDGRFTNAMNTFSRTATGKGLWQWLAGHGELTTLTFVDEERAGPDRIRRFKATLGEGDHWLSIRVTDDGKIAQMYWW